MDGIEKLEGMLAANFKSDIAYLDHLLNNNYHRINNARLVAKPLLNFLFEYPYLWYGIGGTQFFERDGILQIGIPFCPEYCRSIGFAKRITKVGINLLMRHPLGLEGEQRGASSTNFFTKL